MTQTTRRGALFGLGARRRGRRLPRRDASFRRRNRAVAERGRARFPNSGIASDKASRRRDFKTVPMIL